MKNDYESEVAETNTPVSEDGGSEIDKEKALYQKAQRANERILKQLEESTLRSASLEAEYLEKSREFKDKESALEGEIAKLRKEITREKQQLNEEISKSRKKIDSRENTLYDRLSSKLEAHKKVVIQLRTELEDAIKKAAMFSKIQDLEEDIRIEIDARETAESTNRKLLLQLDNAKEDLDKEKANQEQQKEMIQEIEKSNEELILSIDSKKRYERELKEIQETIKNLEKEKSTEKDIEDQITETRGKLRQVKNRRDDLASERERIDKNIARIKAGLDEVEKGSGRINESVSRLDTIERTTAYSRVEAKSRDRDRNLDSSRDTSREDEKKIRELNQNLKTYQRDKERDLEQLDRQLGTAESAVSKAESTFTKLEKEHKDMEKLIKQEKEMVVARLNTLRAKLHFFTNRNDTYLMEIKKENKAFADESFNLSEANRELNDNTKLNTDKKLELENLTLSNDQRQKNLEKIEKEFKNELKLLQDAREKLVDTEAHRQAVQQTLEERKSEFDETKKDFDLEVHTIEAEIYYQIEEREETEKANSLLNTEIESLKWYFRPLNQKGEQETKWYGSVLWDFIIAKREKRYIELDIIKRERYTTNLDEVTKFKQSEDFKREFDRYSGTMNPDEKADFLFELKDLTEAMKLALFKPRTILQTISMLAEHQVYPGAIRELSLITKTLKDQHIMQRTDILLNNVFREFTRDPEAKSFRRRLLERLVFMRMKRTGKSYEQSEDFIFYGEERPEEEIEEEQEELKFAKEFLRSKIIVEDDGPELSDDED